MLMDERAKKHITRLQASHESKRKLMKKIWAVKRLMEVHEDKVLSGDDWRSTYRLPEAFGIAERKKADLLEHLPDLVVESEFNDEYNMAVAAEATIRHFQYEAGFESTLAEVISNAVDYGTGALFNGVAALQRMMQEVDDKDPQMLLPRTAKKLVTYYNGLSSASIDLRDFFPDPVATLDHDPCGPRGMQWAYRRSIYSIDQFKQDFGNNDLFNINGVEPVQWGAIESFGIDRHTTKHESEEKSPNADTTDQTHRYVVVFEGWDCVNDEHVFIANGKVVYEGAIPFKHKQIPIVLYYNYKRDDSIWGISEIELAAPFVFVKEVLVNLMIDNAKLSQQPAIAISGDVGFDPTENELEPGALLTLQGINGGKVGDAIQPLTFGSSVEPANAVKNILEDIQIQVTGDDSRSLFVSPNELATQTMAKREAQKKRIRKNVMLNTIRSQRIVVEQQFQNICQFLARPYQDINGKWKHHHVYVENFRVAQRTSDARPEFKALRGYKGTFKLNADVLDPQYVRLRFAEKIDDSVKKEMELQGMQWYFSTIMTFAQASPGTLKNIDFETLTKEVGKYFTSMDIESIFTSSAVMREGLDELDFYVRQIAQGIKPEFPRDGRNMKRFESLRRFAGTKEFNLLKNESKKVYRGAMLDLTTAIREESTGTYDDYVKRAGMGAAGEDGQQGGVPGVPQAGGAALPQPSPESPAPEAPTDAV